MDDAGPYWLDPLSPVNAFPDIELALEEPDGLLAVGGDLSVNRLLSAYSRGIFPWYNDDQPILWWSPNPRAVLYPGQLKISRSMKKRLRKQEYRITLDQDFAAVIQHCAAPRSSQAGTWIIAEMQQAYLKLHERGYAHSVEAWDGEELVGGLYGISIGKMFFGESMFSRRTDASKVAFIHLVRQLQAWGYPLIDCQVSSEHLTTLGAIEISRRDFRQQVEQLTMLHGQPNPWQMADTETLLSDILKT